LWNVTGGPILGIVGKTVSLLSGDRSSDQDRLPLVKMVLGDKSFIASTLVMGFFKTRQHRPGLVISSHSFVR
jgi:hypothetical protein